MIDLGKQKRPPITSALVRLIWIWSLGNKWCTITLLRALATLFFPRGVVPMKVGENKAWTFSTLVERYCKFARQPVRCNRGFGEATGFGNLLDFWTSLPRLHCTRGTSGVLCLVANQDTATTVIKKPSLHFHTLGRP